MSVASFSTLYTPTTLFFPFSKLHNSVPPFSSSQTKKRCRRLITSVAEDRETIPVVSKDRNVLDSSSPSKDDNTQVAPDTTDDDILTSRAINATIVLGFGAFAVTKLLTIDHDYWHGWTLYEILKYVPEHNWIAYEQSLKANPVLAKMAISGVVYSIGDWIAQCYEGKPIFEFDRARLFRSGLVGFTLHGSLSHYYYQLCETLFPFQQWWVVPAKVAFDQTVWSAIWNSIYFVVLGLLRFDSLPNIYGELKSTFVPMLTAGWKLWPFAHLITYGVIPLEQRLLWVDCIELIWVTILSTYSNEKSESRKSEEVSETGSSTSSQNSKKALVQANEAKAEGNKLFVDAKYEEALTQYELALQVAPDMPSSVEIRSICHANRGVCFLKMGKYENTVKECTKALELNPMYVKALVRRGEANEKLEHFEEAIADMKKILEIDPSNDQAGKSIRRLEPLAAVKREKMKEEMIAKLKDMGNSLLGRFGMSVDNFKAVQDPNTGSYSVSFQQ